MSVAEWAAVVAAGAAVVFVGVMIWLAVAVRRIVARAQVTLEGIEPLLADARTVLETANSAAQKSDQLLATATSVTRTVDSGSKLAYNVFSNPLIKVAALATGFGRGASVLRRKMH